MKVTRNRINEIRTLAPSDAAIIAYTPTHFQDKPAVLVSQKNIDGVYSFAVYADGEIKEVHCSNTESLFDFEKISRAWKDSIENIKISRYGKNHYILNLAKTKDYYQEISKASQPYCKAAEDDTHECEHIAEIIKNINVNIANDTLALSKIAQKNIDQNIETSPSATFDKTSLSIDMEDEINKTLGYSILLNKMSILIGSTGTGKTRTVTNFCRQNSIDLFSTTVGQDGNHKKALFGEKDVENNDSGNIEIARIPGALILAARNVRDNKKPSMLFIDEAFRSEGMDVFTFLTPYEDKKDNRLYYMFNGIEKQRFAYIKNEASEGWALLTKDSSYGLDAKGNMLHQAERNIQNNDLLDRADMGKVTRINKGDLQQFGYQIITNGDIYQEKFKLPVESFFVTFAGNYGTRYEMAQGKLDDAVLSRSIICSIDMTKKTPAELIRIIEKGKKEKYVQTREMSPKEKEDIKLGYKKLLTGILSGIQEVNIALPQKSYNLRNTYDILSIDHVPQNFSNSTDFIKELLKDVFIYNYIEHNTGLENIEPNEVQKEFFEQLIDKSFKVQTKLTEKNTEDIDFNTPIEPDYTVTPATRTKVSL